MRMKEIEKLEGGELDAKLGELKRELGSERSAAKGVGRTANTGRLRELRRTIARILTFKNQKPAPKMEAKKAEARAEQKQNSNAGAQQTAGARTEQTQRPNAGAQQTAGAKTEQKQKI